MPINVHWMDHRVSLGFSNLTILSALLSKINMQSELYYDFCEYHVKRQVQKALATCRAFATQVNSIVREETNLWMAEFQDTLKQLDETVKAKVAVTMPGSVSLVITNGDQCEDDRCVSIDDGATRSGHSKTLAVPGLLAGIHIVRVDGTIGTRAVRAEQAVPITEGSVTSVEMMLS